MRLPNIIGLDLSLTGTGAAANRDHGLEIETERIAVKTKGAERLGDVRHRVGLIIGRCHPEVAVIEDHTSHQPGDDYSKGELGGVIKLMLHDRGIPYFLVQPSKLKMFATGNGGTSTSKDIMVSTAILRFGYGKPLTNDEADAFLLWHFAACRYGFPIAGPADTAKLRQKQLDALKGVDVPALTR